VEKKEEEKYEGGEDTLMLQPHDAFPTSKLWDFCSKHNTFPDSLTLQDLRG